MLIHSPYYHSVRRTVCCLLLIYRAFRHDNSLLSFSLCAISKFIYNASNHFADLEEECRSGCIFARSNCPRFQNVNKREIWKPVHLNETLFWTRNLSWTWMIYTQYLFYIFEVRAQMKNRGTHQSNTSSLCIECASVYVCVCMIVMMIV